MTKTCYFETLEVERTVDESGLKTAFRKLAMKSHPDKNPGDPACEHKFKEISEAYEVLKDGNKRAAYDRYGHAACGRGGGGGHGFGAGFASSFSDIFEDLFGMAGRGGGRSGGRERGADLRYNMEITLEEAFTGKTAQINIPVAVACEACSGAGAKPGTKPKVCATCGGAGRVRQAQGFFTLERTCPGCHGRGQSIDTPCPSCSGQGRVQKERSLSVNIPAGVEDGTRIRVGGECEVPVIDGSKTRVKVPSGTQSSRRFRIVGKGMPVLRSRQMGDMYVQVVVETPQSLTYKQKELLAEFEKLSSGETQPEAAGFFKMVKDFFGNRAGTA